ncbi:Chlorophyll(ide) b reductase NOL, chloroplastic [Vitis vinifera]|uniref:Chlorophyll(Ide) b reductase NOL, chloroplastic n=1 Tax=Vitis vinifera TaxID=29760 RepID=A0A438JBA9_VITVI|nr:Chlorophyll(ide) b reductase NOL, chloroplastic [Vitis vinifera]
MLSVSTFLEWPRLTKTFTAERVESSVESLRREFGKHHVWGTTCDVRKGEDVKDLVAFAQENLKYIDIWVFCSDI